MRFYQKGSFWFNVLIFFFLLFLFILTLGYDEKTRSVPLIILPLALALSVLTLIGEFFPKLLGRTDITLIEIGEENLDAEMHIIKGGPLIGMRGLKIITGYLIGFVVSVFLIGFLITIPLGIFLFMTVFGRQGWFRSMVVSIATWAFIYLLFVVIMKFDIFKGILFGEIVIL